MKQEKQLWFLSSLDEKTKKDHSHIRKIFILAVAADNLIHEVNEQRLAQTTSNPWCKSNWEIKCKW